jgi:hypothetical protein
VTSAVPLDQQVSVVAAVEGSAGILILEIVHVVGLFGGLLLAAVGLLRTHAVAPWAVIALVVGLLGSMAATGDAVIAVAGALLTIGLGSAGARLLGRSGQRWQARDLGSAAAV